MQFLGAIASANIDQNLLKKEIENRNKSVSRIDLQNLRINKSISAAGFAKLDKEDQNLLREQWQNNLNKQEHLKMGLDLLEKIQLASSVDENRKLSFILRDILQKNSIRLSSLKKHENNYKQIEIQQNFISNHLVVLQSIDENKNNSIQSLLQFYDYFFSNEYFLMSNNSQLAAKQFIATRHYSNSQSFLQSQSSKKNDVLADETLNEKLMQLDLEQNNTLLPSAE